jgi:hypothetical protein
LHECLERFNLFGYTMTRERLRHMVGASDDGWAEHQLIGALDALAFAHRSWTEFAERARAERRAEKNGDRTGAGPSLTELHARWLEQYLVGVAARAWRVEGLGSCDRCGHLLIHHRSRTCVACGLSEDIVWEGQCRDSLPPPVNDA